MAVTNVDQQRRVLVESLEQIRILEAQQASQMLAESAQKQRAEYLTEVELASKKAELRAVEVINAEAVLLRQEAMQGVPVTAPQQSQAVAQDKAALQTSISTNAVVKTNNGQLQIQLHGVAAQAFQGAVPTMQAAAKQQGLSAVNLGGGRTMLVTPATLMSAGVQPLPPTPAGVVGPGAAAPAAPQFHSTYDFTPPTGYPSTHYARALVDQHRRLSKASFSSEFVSIKTFHPRQASYSAEYLVQADQLRLLLKAAKRSGMSQDFMELVAILRANSELKAMAQAYIESKRRNAGSVSIEIISLNCN